MSIFDLLFLVAVLVTVVTLLRCLYLLARRRTPSARRAVQRLALFLGAYAVALVAASLLQPKRVAAPGEERCFDEWCIAVDSAQVLPSIGTERADGKFIVVSARILNHGGGRRERESDVYGVVDAGGKRYERSARGQSALARATGDTSTLRDFVDPGASKVVRLVFDLPASGRSVEFLTLHGRFPHIVIIGDPESFLHRPVVVPLRTSS